MDAPLLKFSFHLHKGGLHFPIQLYSCESYYFVAFNIFPPGLISFFFEISGKDFQVCHFYNLLSRILNINITLYFGHFRMLPSFKRCSQAFEDTKVHNAISLSTLTFISNMVEPFAKLKISQHPQSARFTIFLYFWILHSNTSLFKNAKQRVSLRSHSHYHHHTHFRPHNQPASTQQVGRKSATDRLALPE